MPDQYCLENFNGEDLTIISAFEAVGKRQAGEITDEKRQIEIHACPGPGACGGMFTEIQCRA